ncbi:MAG: nucleoside kinase [Bacteroidales bacterium]|nr:nucleoside kinase [Bacteroidales bacterium]
MIRIFCKNTGTFKEFNEGVTLAEVADSFDFPKPYPIISAFVNNVSEGLKYRVYGRKDVQFLDYTTYSGRSVYSRSLCFVLSKAVRDLFPGAHISMKRPISKGYYCTLTKADGSSASTDDISAIQARMAEIIAADRPFRRQEASLDEAVEMFRRHGYEDKVKLLQTSGQVYITYYTLDGEPDYFYDALVPSTGYLKIFALEPLEGGILLRIPDRHHPDRLAPKLSQPKTFQAFLESTRWNKIMGLSNVGDVNLACQKGLARELIQVSEALQEKKIVKMAEAIYDGYNTRGIRLVLITGPSSSGKSTVCRRLSIQLLACGLKPIFFSTDDYFVNRVETPKFPDGSYDFDNFDTVDHDMLQKDILRLLAGEEVEIPHYNFVTGLREWNGRKIKMDDESILIVEGLHALNPDLTDHISDDIKYRIFINTITSISLDDHNCIPTSDNRLLRRILRDYNKGAFSARESIAQWPNVRRAEVQWIYPFQENADVLFNSAYLVEFAVLRSHAEQILSTVPKNCPEYSEASRLLKFLHYFTPVSDAEIPGTSLLKEFVGGGYNTSFKR